MADYKQLRTDLVDALMAIAAIEASDGDYRQFEQDIDTIRRALERLQELEGQGDD